MRNTTLVAVLLRLYKESGGLLEVAVLQNLLQQISIVLGTLGNISLTLPTTWQLQQ